MASAFRGFLETKLIPATFIKPGIFRVKLLANSRRIQAFFLSIFLSFERCFGENTVVLGDQQKSRMKSFLSQDSLGENSL